MLFPILLLLVGLAILLVGAEVLVRGSSSLASKMHISPLVIGLTIVAFGTSAPELIVNIFSATAGTTDLAIGNIIGSNIANILLIVGISASIFPLVVKRSTVWKEIPFALLAIVLVFVMANDALFDRVPFNILTRTDGITFMSLFIIFMYYIFSLMRSEAQNEAVEKVKEYSTGLSVLFSIVGIGALFFGGKLLVDNATELALIAGLSESLIGLTVVAIGTSLPELATSIIAALHKHSDIAVGNVVGSNIFNVLWILGLTSTITPLPFNIQANIDVGVCIAATVLLFLAMFVGKKHRVDRWQGIIFILLYIGYTAYLIQRG
ncbi:MAG TPA: calcium/sodium antiporter [Patescibacteria group bacterium]|nr:calcium/sodium antiporter [Patescibacteria group bacterium]